MTTAAIIILALSLTAGTFEDRCKELIGDRGAVAVMDLETGNLIAATHPEILFSRRFPPGSVAKILTAMVAIDKGIDLPEDFSCTGHEIYGNDTLWCSMRCGHGEVDFTKAMIESCNLYFQNLAKDLTADDLAGIYRTLKLEHRVGVDLSGETESIILVPATDSAKLEFAIGQGSAIQLTPVAMLSLISGVATGGQLLRPRLAPGKAQVLSSFPSQNALHRVRGLLRQAVRQGTGKEAEITTVEVAGKTGTSTVLGDWVTHGWFVGFAPFEGPRIAVVVFLHRGEGKDAARIAGLVIFSYFRGSHGGS
ncbi:hypothetical protein JXM67_10195 [candidate division WOR-3 bacterium]|nr:hypothetical protein [candidate division WOR-3 bacterium]